MDDRAVNRVGIRRDSAGITLLPSCPQEMIIFHRVCG